MTRKGEAIAPLLRIFEEQLFDADAAAAAD
jgi:hypothetical protein